MVAPGVIVEQRPNFWWLLLALALFVALPIFWLLRRPRQPISSPSSPAVPPTTTVDPVRPSEPAHAATDLVASDWIEESVMAPTVVFQPVSELVSEPVSEQIEPEQIEPEIITQVITSEFVESEQIEARSEQSEPEFVESEFTESEFTESEQVAQEFVEPELTPPSLLDETELVDADISDPEITSEQIEADLELAEDQAEPTDETVVEETSDLGIAEHPTSELTIPEPIPEPIVVTLPEVASLKVTPPLETQPTSLKQAWLTALSQQGKTPATATLFECYSSLSTLLCQRMLSLKTADRAARQQKIVGEIAAEYLPGPHLENSLINLGLLTEAQDTVQELGLNWQELLAQEEEPGLGRGGLGRLMVCYLDSLATLNLPAIGYGLRYEYGIFDQEIHDGWQVEVSDTWLRQGNPWEVERPELAVTVGFAGSSAAYMDDQGRYRLRWLPAESVQGIPYDSPIPGYHTDTVSLMRLWRADANDLCKVLYPVDLDVEGKALRLKQQFFLVSCALQDALRLHLATGGIAETLPNRFALQINDTDPSLAVAELMRLLVDEHSLRWETAWTVTQQTFAYTNHSLMPETLDDLWSVGLFEQLLPRHLEIIYEINARLLDTIQAKYANDPTKLIRMSLIDERGERYIRLNFLACLGSHAVNGVSQLHTDLLKQTVFRDFYELNPEQFSNQTNGITPRRFLRQTNPELAALISSKLGEGWITDLSQLSGLEAYATDPLFCTEWLRIKQAAKRTLASQILRQTGIEVNPNSLFDLQAMVMHEYKRQHLNLLHILTLYNRLKANPNLDVTARSFIFAGKAAPDYFTAKLMIRLIHAVADLVNHDPDLRGRLKVVFLPDFNIKTAQPLYPAADLSEHLSLAGTEAGDTGNLIAALNGALIMGTVDGTNLEFRESVGAKNWFEFGLSLAEAQHLKAEGYNPMSLYETNPELRAALDLLTSDQLTGGDPELFRPLVNLLLYYDQYLLLADYADYIASQEQVSQAYRDTERWTHMSILSAARLGFFSSDRAVQAYCQEIWQIPTDRPQPDYAQAKKRLG